ncbi:metal-dependent phosphohydrolase [Psychromonas marina]|uniref:Metal-dependent phosphohydrolase n=1 Tax=Psychromonas marina TaxID=88364 RepID=A0ABQ6DZL5_9GAMM|nr:HDOD domain-containing protein [Psychromonas marina]GLS90425.1 metal-dependent phosphohydrolase [Psychromonas marina]
MQKKLSSAFYDAMFGPEQLSTEINAIEEKALNNVRDILNNPVKLSHQIPPLPTVLLELIDTLKNDNATFIDIALVIEKDPSLAIEVLKVANSSLYYTGNGEITSLKKAVSLIGVSGIASISSTILMKKIRPAAPIYYKMFGRQIWMHSMQCAFLCKALAKDEKQDEFDAYFLGLIHDIGKIIIFNCLCEALRSEPPSSSPGTRTFKALMTEMSADISFFIAQEWGLPAIYCDALQAHRNVRSSALATTLYKGNLLSETYLLVKNKGLDDDIIDRLLSKLSVDKQIWIAFIALCPEIEKHV